MVAAVVHFTPDPITDWTAGALWNILVGLLAFLMISTVRYPSFKEIDLGNRKSYINVYLLAMLVALIYLYSQVVLLLLATAYAGSGLIVKIYNLLKHKNESILSSETLVPHPDDTK